MIIGKSTFDFTSHTYIMGILNVSPDSFYDGGRYRGIDAVLARAEVMIAEGCDIIDIGGESTRPGHTEIGAAEEIDRVTPVIESLRKHFDTPLSLDTRRAETAAAGLAAGTDMINDIEGLRRDERMAAVIASRVAACCLMHNGCNEELKHDLIDEVRVGLAASLELARAAGIADDRIILDPGIGFGKDREENIAILARLGEFKSLGFPCLLGASRKSVIGLTLDLPVDERLEGTIVTTVMAVLAGYAFVRVHDIAANKRAIKMTEEIIRHSSGILESRLGAAWRLV